MRRSRQERPDILAVLAHYGITDMPECNWWRSVRCPFHDDRTKSAQIITVDGGAFSCFACDVSGSGFDLIMWKEGLSFRDAVKFYTRIAGDGDGGVRGATAGRGQLSVGTGGRREDRRYLPARRGRGTGART